MDIICTINVEEQITDVIPDEEFQLEVPSSWYNEHTTCSNSQRIDNASFRWFVHCFR
jgi:hypothetical protein